MDAIVNTPAAEVKPLSPAEIRAAAIKSWHDAKTEADRIAAVTKFPVLVEIFTIASQYQPKK